MAKSETRALAEPSSCGRPRSPTAEICFVPNGDYASVVRKLRPEANQPGEIVDMAGEVVGRHDGIVRFTVGQRRGLGWERAPAPQRSTSIRAVEPRGPRRRRPAERLGRRRSRSTDVNWIGPSLAGALPVQVRWRPARPCGRPRSSVPATQLSCASSEPEIGVSPGQACVMYDQATAAASWEAGSFAASRRRAMMKFVISPSGQHLERSARLVRPAGSD